MNRLNAGFGFLFVLTALPAGAQHHGDLTAPAESEGTVVADTIRWNKNTRHDFKLRERITPKTAVSLRILNFNYIRYEPVITVEARTLPGYSELENLWSQVLAVGELPSLKVGGAFAREQAPFLQAMSIWRERIAKERKNLADALLHVPGSVGLSDKGVDSIRIVREEEASSLKSLEKDRAAADFLVLQQAAWVVLKDTASKDTAPSNNKLVMTPNPNSEAYYAQALYDAQIISHKEVVSKIQSFVDLAGHVANGRAKDFETRKAGTIVTVGIRVKALSGSGADADSAEAAGITTVSYYVQSPMPVVFHGGPAYTHIEDFDLEKVQRANQGDVFQQIDKPSDGADLTAFMTYMLTPLDLAAGFGLTIGTGVRKIGQRLYLGATAKFNDRLLLTGGGFSQTVKQGDVAISEGQNIFESIKNVRKWGWFASFSVSPF